MIDIFLEIVASDSMLRIIAILSIVGCFLVLLALYLKAEYHHHQYSELFWDESNEKKRLQKLNYALQNELITFASLLDEITFPIWQRDKDLKIRYCNTRFCEIIGNTRDNILNSNELELFKDAREIASNALNQNKPQFIEQNIVINGEKTLNQIVEIPVNNLKIRGNIKAGTIGFALNFSELQNTREKLKHYLESQNKLLESSGNAIAIYNANQRLEYFNHAFVALWKLDQRWLDSSPTYGEILEVLREKRKLPEQADFTAFKKENVGMFKNLIAKKELYYYQTDGTVIKAIVIPQDGGGLLFYYEDLTNEISLERSYNTLLSVQKSTLDNLNEAVAVFGEDGRLKLYNPTYEKIWWLDESVLQSEPHINDILLEEKPLHSYDDWEEYKAEFLSDLYSRKSTEKKIYRSDNIVLLQRFTPLPDGATLLTYFDITDKENVEKSLRSEKMALEEAERIKTNFLSNVSYELRSPLMSVMGFAEILSMEYFAKIDEKSKDYLKAIIDSSVKLKYLIDNIIDVSSIDAGYVKLTAANIYLPELINEISVEINKEATRKAVSITYNVEDNVKDIIADKDRLKQVLRTVVNNAVLMGYKNSEVSVSIFANGNNIRFEVEDSGPGLEPHDLKNIFDQFFKIQSDSVHGTGLGLYLAKKIIEMHGGYIIAESEIGIGTKFIFEIPKRNEQLIH
jgi:signal transduction histidine kinase